MPVGSPLSKHLCVPAESQKGSDKKIIWINEAHRSSDKLLLQMWQNTLIEHTLHLLTKYFNRTVTAGIIEGTDNKGPYCTKSNTDLK